MPGTKQCSRRVGARPRPEPGIVVAHSATHWPACGRGKTRYAGEFVPGHPGARVVRMALSSFPLSTGF